MLERALHAHVHGSILSVIPDADDLRLTSHRHIKLLAIHASFSALAQVPSRSLLHLSRRDTILL